MAGTTNKKQDNVVTKKCSICNNISIVTRVKLCKPSGSSKMVWVCGKCK